MRESSNVVRDVTRHHLEENRALRDLRKLVVEEHLIAVVVKLALIWEHGFKLWVRHKHDLEGEVDVSNFSAVGVETSELSESK